MSTATSELLPPTTATSTNEVVAVGIQNHPRANKALEYLSTLCPPQQVADGVYMEKGSGDEWRLVRCPDSLDEPGYSAKSAVPLATFRAKVGRNGSERIHILFENRGRVEMEQKGEGNRRYFLIRVPLRNLETHIPVAWQLVHGLLLNQLEMSPNQEIAT